MPYADGRYQISYNGEIYNYRELKEELKRAGCEFRTNSDTEVILAAYEEWGTEAFARLNGMFALAILDERERRIVLARDPIGIKPLYWGRSGRRVWFASELRAARTLGRKRH